MLAGEERGVGGFGRGERDQVAGAPDRSVGRVGGELRQRAAMEREATTRRERRVGGVGVCGRGEAQAIAHFVDGDDASGAGGERGGPAGGGIGIEERGQLGDGGVVAENGERLGERVRGRRQTRERGGDQRGEAVGVERGDVGGAGRFAVLGGTRAGGADELDGESRIAARGARDGAREVGVGVAEHRGAQAGDGELVERGQANADDAVAGELGEGALLHFGDHRRRGGGAGGGETEQLLGARLGDAGDVEDRRRVGGGVGERGDDCEWRLVGEAAPRQRRAAGGGVVELAGAARLVDEPALAAAWRALDEDDAGVAERGAECLELAGAAGERGAAQGRRRARLGERAIDGAVEAGAEAQRFGDDGARRGGARRGIARQKPGDERLETGGRIGERRGAAGLEPTHELVDVRGGERWRPAPQRLDRGAERPQNRRARRRHRRALRARGSRACRALRRRPRAATRGRGRRGGSRRRHR